MKITFFLRYLVTSALLLSSCAYFNTFYNAQQFYKEADKIRLEKDGEIILVNSHIAAYKEASYTNHNPTDERKLLLNRREINKLIGKVNREGLTIIPTKMYFKKGKAKVEIAIAKGKKLYDKRQVKKKRDWNRERARLLSRNNK